MIDTANDLFAEGELAPDYPQLQALAHGLLADSENDLVLGAIEDQSGRLGTTIELQDLIADDGGEIVFDGSGPIALSSPWAVTEQGQIEKHQTANGDDVSGFSFLGFDSGVTLYFPNDVELVVTPMPNS